MHLPTPDPSDEAYTILNPHICGCGHPSSALCKMAVDMEQSQTLLPHHQDSSTLQTDKRVGNNALVPAQCKVPQEPPQWYAFLQETTQNLDLQCQSTPAFPYKGKCLKVLCTTDVCGTWCSGAPWPITMSVVESLQMFCK